MSVMDMTQHRATLPQQPMKLTVPQITAQGMERPVVVSEGGSEKFNVPIRLGAIQRALPASPGRYLILLRQSHQARPSRPWKWGREVGEM
jgi:hypothetical protein